MTPAIVVKEIWIYPIKSLGGIRLERSPITAAGSLALDREWVVVDPEGKKLFQGDLPRMALSRCRLDDLRITVTMPGMPPLVVERAHDGPARDISMYKQVFAGIDAGDAAAAWLSAALDAPVRLVRIGAAGHGWSGFNPVHVLSTASLAALNEALAERGDAAVEIERFRPSLVLDTIGGTLPPYYEERHATIAFGDLQLRFNEPCVRCELPNISRLDASRQRQPLKLIGALSRERPAAAPASFGIYARLTGAAAIATGTVATGLEPRRLTA